MLGENKRALQCSLVSVLFFLLGLFRGKNIFFLRNYDKNVNERLIRLCHMITPN